MNSEHYDLAAAAIRKADKLLIAAGAGMGVDSGLPDFRREQGFWKAYPPFAKLGLDFAAVANPRWFRDDPEMAWGFYGHRHNLYQATEPHRGFAILRSWVERMKGGTFVFTSNVDGHFQKAGFNELQIHEVHGSLEWLQCLERCGADLFPAGPDKVAVDPTTFRASRPLPACADCGGMARPNVLMFGDGGWQSERADAQAQRLRNWVFSNGVLTIVEFGAGTGVPTVRHYTEKLAAVRGATLVRVNPRDADAPNGALSLPVGSLEAIEAIDERLR